jgi:hypothetical protein
MCVWPWPKNAICNCKIGLAGSIERHQISNALIIMIKRYVLTCFVDIYNACEYKRESWHRHAAVVIGQTTFFNDYRQRRWTM